MVPQLLWDCGSNHSQAPGLAIKPPLVSLAALSRYLGAWLLVQFLDFKCEALCESLGLALFFLSSCFPTL